MTSQLALVPACAGWPGAPGGGSAAVGARPADAPAGGTSAAATYADSPGRPWNAAAKAGYLLNGGGLFAEIRPRPPRTRGEIARSPDGALCQHPIRSGLASSGKHWHRQGSRRWPGRPRLMTATPSAFSTRAPRMTAVARSGPRPPGEASVRYRLPNVATPSASE